MADDKRCCPFIEPCPMFKYFRKYAKVIYQNTYCLGNYEQTCARYKLRIAGKPVPPDLMPHGAMLPLERRE
jgi:hypothetical protein